jgi:hypothetical protein
VLSRIGHLFVQHRTSFSSCSTDKGQPSGLFGRHAEKKKRKKEKKAERSFRTDRAEEFEGVFHSLSVDERKIRCTAIWKLSQHSYAHNMIYVHTVVLSGESFARERIYKNVVPLAKVLSEFM